MPEHLSIVIPAFNEEHRIQPTIRAVCGYMAARHALYEVIIADDGSRDATRQIVTDLRREGLPLTLLPAETNRGKGSAVRRGVAASTGDLVLISDADLATPIEELEKLLERLRSGADIAIGSRSLKESDLVVRQPPHRERLGKLFNVLVQVTILRGIWDTQCGFKLFRGPVARKLFALSTLSGFAFDIEVLGLAKRTGCAIAEVPVRWSHIHHSKLRPWRDGFSMFLDLIRIVYRLYSGWYAVADLSPAMDGARPSVASEKP